jgi:hypothetical protein
MSTIPRAVYPTRHVEEAPAGQPIVKYMSWQKFQDLVTRSALYFRRIDHFIDTFEGNIPLAVWNLNNQVIQDWYNGCKEEIFVSCWNMDEAETPAMWRDYADGYGVRISSTVGALTTELSFPPLPSPEPYERKYVEWAEKTGAKLAEVDERPQDGFTLGKIKYINFDKIDVHEVLSEGPSNTVPAFRKRDGYVSESEFRAILRPASKSGDDARARGDVHVFVPVRLQNLIQEIRFAPVDDAPFEGNIKKLLADSGLSIATNPAALGIKKA